MTNEKLALFRLFLTADIGIVKFLRLIEFFGNASCVFNAAKNDLLKVEGINEKIATAVLNAKTSRIAEKELELAAKHDIKIISCHDQDYPEPLKGLDDKPIFIYIRGTYKKQDRDSIAIVGARNPSIYGKSVSAQFADFFAKNNITLISGLARGIDTQAHLSALKYNSRTMAVLGNGLLVNYPPENAKIQAKIPENGAVISEFPLLREPDPGTFPRRNRIVAGLAKATLIVEARTKSGALITARYAANYGKDVFAVPGNIHSQLSRGTNLLINKGAFAALSPQDMAESLSYIPIYNGIGDGPAAGLTDTERKILRLIENSPDGISPDAISEKTKIAIPEISGIMLALEIHDLITIMPGQICVKKR